MPPEKSEEDSKSGPHGWWVWVAGGIALAIVLYVGLADSSMLTALSGNQSQAFVFVVLISIFVWVFTTMFTALAERDRDRQFKALKAKNREMMAKIDSLLQDKRRWEIYNEEAATQDQRPKKDTASK